MPEGELGMVYTYLMFAAWVQVHGFGDIGVRYQRLSSYGRERRRDLGGRFFSVQSLVWMEEGGVLSAELSALGLSTYT